MKQTYAYQAPEATLVLFDKEDLLTASGLPEDCMDEWHIFR